MVYIKILAIYITIIVVAIFSFSSCVKEEGFGGNSSISGKLIERVYNDDFSILLAETPADDEEVSIIFGDDLVIGDDRTTNYNGAFEFNYLFPGKYTVFYYSEDSILDYDDNYEVTYEIDLSKNENYNMGDIYILKTLDFDDGQATIKGTVYLINYLNISVYPNLIVKDTTLAQEQEIYLTYGNHEFYDERIRTQFDGTFVFPNLIKGHYKVFLYSEDISGGTEDIVIMFEMDIINETEEIDLGDIFIEQL